MKVSRNPMFSFMTAAIVFGASSFAAAQSTAPAPASPQPAAKPPAQSQPAMQTMTMQGELVSVDTDEKTFIVMGSASAASSASAPAASAPAAGAPAAGAARSSAASQTVEFTYDDDTAVTGSQTRIEGLAGAKASRVTVHYREQAGEKLATRIEVQAAGAAPSSTSTPGSSAQPKPPASATPNPPAAPGAPPQGAPR